MAGYNFEIEYVWGSDNKVADALSQVGERLDEDAVKELSLKNCLAMLHTMASHEQRPMTQGSLKNMRGQRVKSLCRCECWQK